MAPEWGNLHRKAVYKKAEVTPEMETRPAQDIPLVEPASGQEKDDLPAREVSMPVAIPPQSSTPLSSDDLLNAEPHE